MSYKYERSVDINFNGANQDDVSLDLQALSLTNTRYKFRHTGILISGSAGEVATIVGILMGNGDNKAEYTLECNRTHCLAFRKIFRDGTTTKTFQVLGA